MSLTAKKASKLLKKIKTEEALLSLIEELDVSSTGKVTLLYSGPLADRSTTGYKDISSSDMVKALHQGMPDDIRIIDKTEAARFLQVNERYGDANTDLLKGTSNNWLSIDSLRI